MDLYTPGLNTACSHDVLMSSNAFVFAPWTSRSVPDAHTTASTCSKCSARKRRSWGCASASAPTPLSATWLITMEDFGVARDLEVAHTDACLKCNQGDYTETFGPRMIIYCDSCLRQVHVVRVARAPAGPLVASALKGRPQLEDCTQECEEERSGSKITQSALDGNLWFCSPACKNIHRSLGQLEGGEAPFDLLLESTFSLEVVGTNSSARGAAEFGLQGAMATHLLQHPPQRKLCAAGGKTQALNILHSCFGAIPCIPAC